MKRFLWTASAREACLPRPVDMHSPRGRQGAGGIMPSPGPRVIFRSTRKMAPSEMLAHFQAQPDPKHTLCADQLGDLNTLKQHVLLLSSNTQQHTPRATSPQGNVLAQNRLRWKEAVPGVFSSLEGRVLCLTSRKPRKCVFLSK